MISPPPFVDLLAGSCATAFPVPSVYDESSTFTLPSVGVSAKPVAAAASPIASYTDSFLRYSYLLLNHPSPSAYVTHLQLYYQVICLSQLTHTNMAIALYFLYRYLRNTYNVCDLSMTYQVILTALVLSNKSFDDQSYTLKTWSNLLDMDLSMLNQLEAHFLNVTNFSLPFNKIDEEFYLTFGTDDQFREFVRSLLSPKTDNVVQEPQPVLISPMVKTSAFAVQQYAPQVSAMFTPTSSSATPLSADQGLVPMLPYQPTFHVPHFQGSLYSYPVRHYPRSHNNMPGHHHAQSFSSPLSSICPSPQMLNSPHYTIQTGGATAYRYQIPIPTFAHISQPSLKRRKLQTHV